MRPCDPGVVGLVVDATNGVGAVASCCGVFDALHRTGGGLRVIAFSLLRRPARGVEVDLG